jgi:hypothetical protein
VTTPQPQWRYVPFVSTLLMCSGLFMLLHGAPPQSTRLLSHGNGCEGVGVPGTSQSLSKTPGGEDLDFPDQRADSPQPFIAASSERPADADPLETITSADANPWSPVRFSALWLRGPPSVGDADNTTHRLGTGPVDSSLDATDDDDDGDDDPDTDDGDGPATLVAASADISCVLHPSSLLSRVEVHHPVSFTSDVQSLRAPPQ